MARFGIKVVVLGTIFAFMITPAYVASITCHCTITTSDQNCSSGTCLSNGSCFRMAVQVDSNAQMTLSGCVDSPQGAGVEIGIKFMRIRHGLAYVALHQCSNDNCNDETQSWSSLGVNGARCQFDKLGDVVSVDWDKAGNVVNNISGWCPNCPYNITKPKSGESLCGWFSETATNESEPIQNATTKSYTTTDKIGLYASAGVLGAVFVVVIALSVLEFIKAKRMQRARPPAGHRKKVQKEIKLASPLTAFGTIKPQSPPGIAKGLAKEAPSPGKRSSKGTGSVGKETAKDPGSTPGKEPSIGKDKTTPTSPKDKTAPTAGTKSKVETTTSAKGKSPKTAK